MLDVELKEGLGPKYNESRPVFSVSWCDINLLDIEYTLNTLSLLLGEEVNYCVNHLKTIL